MLIFQGHSIENRFYFATCLSAAPITKNLQLGFMDNLLSTYRELEQSFMINVYELYKALRFRTLWEGNDPLANFQRVASESARGTGQLNGIIQLTDVLQTMEQTETKAVQCFTNNVYTTNINKWSFEKTKNPDVSSRIPVILRWWQTRTECCRHNRDFPVYPHTQHLL